MRTVRSSVSNAMVVQTLLGPLGDEPGFPPPIREYTFHPARRWRFDLAWPDQKVALELEGGVYASLPSHSSIRGRERDYEKSNEAVALGWRVLHYTYERIRRDIDGARSCLRRVLDGPEGRPGSHP